jgi:hypothetical protein
MELLPCELGLLAHFARENRALPDLGLLTR